MLWHILLFFLVLVGTGSCRSASSESARSEPFIIGGRTVSPSNKWPGIAAIVDRGTLHCMGALINPYYVVTVAHGTASAYDLDVVLGLHDLTNRQGTQTIRVQSRIRHERYNRGRGLYANDIGLLVLSRPAAISNDVNVFQLAQHDIMTSSCYYIGWGGTRESGPISNVLLEGGAATISYTECQPQWGRNINPSVHTCTRGSLPCNAKGAPLMCMEDGRYYLSGLSSFTRACDTGYPSVSTRIPGLFQWIRDKTGGAVATQPPPTRKCSNVTSMYLSSPSIRSSTDEVWCNTAQTGNLVLTEGTGGRSHSCTYAWRTDDGLYMIEIQCDGYVTRKQTFTLGSAKAEALCSAKHSLMARGPNRPVGNTVAVCDGTPASATDPYVTMRCVQ